MTKKMEKQAWYLDFCDVPYTPKTFDGVHLTARERELITYNAKGFTLVQAADLMGITFHTVNDYAKNIHKKTNFSSMMQLTQAAIEAGMVGLPDPNELAQLIRRYDTLSPTHRKILHHVALGEPYKQIARSCAITEARVRDHLLIIRAKMDISERAELMRAWVGLKREADRLALIAAAEPAGASQEHAQADKDVDDHKIAELTPSGASLPEPQTLATPAAAEATDHGETLPTLTVSAAERVDPVRPAWRGSVRR